MAGLLDWLNTPQGMGLLSAAAGGLAGARRGTPINNIGRGAMSGLMGYSNAQDQIRADEENAFAKQYKQAQLADMQDKSARERAMRESLQKLYQPAGAYQADNPFNEDLGNLQNEAKFAGKSLDPVTAAVLPYAQPDEILKMYGPQANENMFGKVMPHNYTPESLSKYQQSKNFADLQPVGGNASFGNVNPGQFTPESLATYQQTGNYADLVPFRAPTVINRGGQIDVLDSGRGTVQSLPVSLRPGELPSVQAAQTRATEQVKAEVGAAEDLRKAAPANNKAISTLDRLDADIEAVSKHPGLKYAVGSYSMVPVIPGTKQADAAASIQNLADRAAVNAIAEMRAASKTGGAVGAVSEKEWPKLEAQMSNLNRAQTYTQFQTELKKFQAQVRESRRLINEAGKLGGSAPKATRKYNPATGRIE